MTSWYGPRAIAGLRYLRDFSVVALWGSRLEPGISSIQFTRFSAFYLAAHRHHGGRLSRTGGTAAAAFGVCAWQVGDRQASSTARCTSRNPRPRRRFGPLEQGKRPPALHLRADQRDGRLLPPPRAIARAHFAWERLQGRKVVVDHGASRWRCSSTPATSELCRFRASSPWTPARRRHDRRFPQGARRLHSPTGTRAAASSSMTAPATSSPRSPAPSGRARSRARRDARLAQDRHGAALHAPTAKRAAGDRHARCGDRQGRASFSRASTSACSPGPLLPTRRLAAGPHVEITALPGEATVDIFLHAGLITQRHRYEDVIASPPGAA